MGKMREHSVWTFVGAPVGANIVDGKWHYAFKFNSNGGVTDHKSPLVTNGFSYQQV
jgi:hypothetical protein